MCTPSAVGRRRNVALHVAAFENRLRQPEKRSGNRSFRTVQDKIGPARTDRTRGAFPERNDHRNRHKKPAVRSDGRRGRRHGFAARGGYFFVTAPLGEISTPETSVPELPASFPTETQ